MAYIANLNPGRVRLAPKISSLSIIGWFGMARQRRQLKALDAHLLQDIGISHREAKTEARRPFWDAPAHWRN
jgi:uncharacterized protein YjiS (DUF1127 family)